VVEKRDLGNSETVIIHVCTNDLRAMKNLDFVMGEVYVLMANAESKYLNCRLVLSGVLRRKMCHGVVFEHLMVDSTG
jgi:hypothetical protein